MTGPGVFVSQCFIPYNRLVCETHATPIKQHGRIEVHTGMYEPVPHGTELISGHRAFEKYVFVYHFQISGFLVIRIR